MGFPFDPIFGIPQAFYIVIVLGAGILIFVKRYKPKGKEYSYERGRFNPRPRPLPPRPDRPGDQRDQRGPQQPEAMNYERGHYPQRPIPKPQPPPRERPSSPDDIERSQAGNDLEAQLRDLQVKKSELEKSLAYVIEDISVTQDGIKRQKQAARSRPPPPPPVGQNCVAGYPIAEGEVCTLEIIGEGANHAHFQGRSLG